MLKRIGISGVSILKSFVYSFIIVLIPSFIVVGGVHQEVKLFELELDKVAINPEPTVVYDKNGDILIRAEQDRKEATTYDEIPVEIIQAVVATEDREFFEHSGVNVKAIMRAMVKDVIAKDFVQGGSTITQQLAKNIFLHPGKTIERKLEEAMIATALEKEYNKKEIMAYYLNHIFFGHRAYGIKNAVETYFGESLEEFNEGDRMEKITKAALLAGLPQAPSAHSPYMNPEQAEMRRNAVLANMFVEGFITKEEYDTSTKNGFLVLDEVNDVHDDEIIRYPELVHYTLSEVADILDISFEEARFSGLKIYTSFDPKIYEELQAQLKRDELYPTNASDGTELQGAGVILNPKNGEIYALAGGRDEIKEFTAWNRAFQMERQPGSSFKPIIDYGPALESGKYSPWSTVKCQPSFGSYTVKDHGCSGSKSMTDALVSSNNQPAVWMLNQIGIPEATKFANKLGIELTDKDVYLPLALGGLHKGVTPLEMADAYQVFANDGKRTDAHAVTRMVSRNGEIIYEPKEPVQTIKPSTASNMSAMLREVVTRGTGRSAEVPGYNIKGKTGTTEYKSMGNQDLWFVGYTDYMVGAVWMGFDSTNDSHYIRSGQTSYFAAGMFGEIAKKILPILPKEEEAEEEKKDEDLKEIEANAYILNDGKTVHVEWDYAPGIRYEIYRDGGGIGDTVGNSFEDHPSKDNKSYEYYVLGYNRTTGERVVKSNEIKVKVPKFKEEKPKEEEEVADKKKDEDEKNEKQEEEQVKEKEKPKEEKPKEEIGEKVEEEPKPPVNEEVVETDEEVADEPEADTTKKETDPTTSTETTTTE